MRHDSIDKTGTKPPRDDVPGTDGVSRKPVKAAKSTKSAAATRAGKAVAPPALPAKAPAGRKSGKAPPVAAAAELPAVRIKLVRDSFTMPADEYEALRTLKLRGVGLGHVARKSELLRAGIQSLGRMSDAALLEALSLVAPLKAGRPKKVKAVAPAAQPARKRRDK